MPHQILSAIAFAFLVRVTVDAQVLPTDPQTRVFHGTSVSCIFNDAGNNARNCFTDTATFLTGPAPTQRSGFFLAAQRLRSEDVTFTGSGFDLGGPTGGLDPPSKASTASSPPTPAASRRTSPSSPAAAASGDCANYFYMEHDGGVAATGDEAVEALGLQANENPHPYAGQLLATTGPGDTQPKLSGGGGQVGHRRRYPP